MNYGFSAQVYSPLYLDAVGAVVDPRAPGRSIVLGIAPHNFLRSKVATNQFVDFARKAGPYLWWDQRCGGTLDPYDLGANRPGRGLWRHRVNFHADGWGALRREPEDPTAYLDTLKATYDRELPDDDIQTDLLLRVRRWTDQGIRVFAIRVPVSGPVFSAEAALADFPYDRFKVRLARSGGTWLDVDEAGLVSADGSHLRDTSAAEYSLRLARVLRPYWERRGRGTDPSSG